MPASEVSNDFPSMRGRRWLFVALALLIALAGAGCRSLDAWYVFGTPEVRFTGDVDVLYHVARSAQLANGEGEVWFDSRIEFPFGARVLWPPGFDAAIAGAARVVCGMPVERPCLERVAATAPVIWGMAGIVLVAAIGAVTFGRRAALVAALLVAILPINAWWSILGRPDHHVAEIFWTLLATLGFERGSRTSGWSWWNVVLGVALGLAPWFWQGAILNVIFLGSFLAVALAGLIRPEVLAGAAAGLWRGAAISAAVACIPLVVTSPPSFWQPPSLAGMSAVQAAALAVTAGWAWVVTRVASRGTAAARSRRVGIALVTAAGGGVLLVLLFPGAIQHGLRAATATDAFWATVAEAMPLMFSGRTPLRDEIRHVATFVGPALFTPLVVVPWKWREWSARQAIGPWLVAWGGLLFMVLGLRSMRFVLYASPFVALLAGDLIVGLMARIPRAVPRVLAGAALTALFGYPAVLNLGMTAPVVDDDAFALLQWLRGRADPGHSVLAPWSRGHEIQWYAGAPVVTTPFATDIGDAGTKDFARFLFARDPSEAAAIMDRRKVRFVVLDPVLPLLQVARPFADVGNRRVLVSSRDATGRRIAVRGPEYDEVFGVLLHDFDGAPDRLPGGKAAEGLRLVYETPDRGLGVQKVFERVRGACIAVSGLSGGDIVRLSIPVTTNQGRKFIWWTSQRADDTGKAEICQPFATGRNGAVVAGPTLLSTSTSRHHLGVEEVDVLNGHVLHCASRGPAVTCGTR